MDNLRVREAGAEDIAPLVAIIHTAFEEYRGHIDPPSGAHRETVESIRQKMMIESAVIAEIETRPVGCVFYQSEGEHIHLGRLSVIPEFRRSGIGRALVAEVENRAIALGIHTIQLFVRIALQENMTFYERQGYRVIREMSHEGHREPTYVVMEKRLAAE
jgi:ribosomal protein S18 acetylase RimI-like enzyme